MPQLIVNLHMLLHISYVLISRHRFVKICGTRKQPHLKLCACGHTKLQASVVYNVTKTAQVSRLASRLAAWFGACGHRKLVNLQSKALPSEGREPRLVSIASVRPVTKADRPGYARTDLRGQGVSRVMGESHD